MEDDEIYERRVILNTTLNLAAVCIHVLVAVTKSVDFFSHVWSWQG